MWALKISVTISASHQSMIANSKNEQNYCFFQTSWIYSAHELNFMLLDICMFTCKVELDLLSVSVVLNLKSNKAFMNGTAQPPTQWFLLQKWISQTMCVPGVWRKTGMYYWKYKSGASLAKYAPSVLKFDVYIRCWSHDCCFLQFSQ